MIAAAGGSLMKNYNSGSKLIVLLFAAMSLVVGAASQAGAGADFARQDLGNSQLFVWREADFGNQLGLSIYIDGIPITTLSRGEGYQAVVRSGRHVLTVTDTPCPYGKTKFTHLTVDFTPGKTYAFTAIWEFETILLQAGDHHHLDIPWMH
jgi:hypothetical protein